MKPYSICGHEKYWNGDDPKCPFSSSEKFSDNNWNCGLINEIRDICDRAMNGDRPHELHYVYCDDQKYVTIKTDDIGLDRDDDINLGLCLFVTWYKSRGRTDGMWILSSHEPPRVPTHDELKVIVDYYNTPEG